jgi:hypothetical protein
LVHNLAYLIVASFAVALARAWSLLQGKHMLDPKTVGGLSSAA